MRYQQLRPLQSERGQALIEFALTISITLLLIFGMIELSRAVYTASIIQWAAQQGARTGIVDGNQAALVAAVYERMVGLNNCPVPEECIVITYLSNNVVQVDVTYVFKFVVPVVAQNSIEMHASASMVAY